MNTFDPAKARARTAALIFATVLLTTLLLAGGRTYSLDDETHFLVTQAIVEHGTFAIAAEMDKPVNTTEGVDGRRYAYYAPGTSLMGIPFYVAGKLVAKALHVGHAYPARSLFSIQGIFWGALGAVIIYMSLLALGADERHAVAISLIHAFASYSFMLARTTATNFPMAILIFYAWRTWLDEHDRFGNGIRAGLALSLAMLYRYDSVLSIPFLLIGGRRRAAGMIAGIIPGGAAAAWYNYARFGSPFATGSPDIANMFSGDFIEGFIGLTVHPSRGLLWYSPLALPGFIGLIMMRRFTAGKTLVPAAICVFQLLMVSSHAVWNGGACWGPRHLAMLIPFTAIGLLPYIERGQAFITRIGIASCIALQLMGAVVATDSWNDLLWDYAIPYERSWSSMEYNPWYGQTELIKRVSFERIPDEYRTGGKLIPVGSAAPNQIMRKSLDFWWMYAWKVGIGAKSIAALVICLVAVNLVLWKKLLDKI